jgi:hypothetical protein
MCVMQREGLVAILPNPLPIFVYIDAGCSRALECGEFGFLRFCINLCPSF